MKFLIVQLIRIQDILSKAIDVFAIQDNRGLHPKHYLTKYSDFFTENIEGGQRVLDIGCGNGYVARRIAEKAGTVLGIDLDSKKISTARKKYAKENLNFAVGDATVYPFTESYDAIVLSNVLEHIEDRQGFLKKIRLLAPRLLIRVPALDRDWLVLYKKELGQNYMSDKTHHIEYTMESFSAEMKDAGIGIVHAERRFGEIWAVVKTR